MIENEIHEVCDDSCDGAESGLVEQIREKMIDDTTTSDLANIFKALGDPTRVKIIFALLQHELCVHDISEVLDMGQSAVSHQLRYLRNLRIVKRRKEGKVVYYSLDDNHIEEIFVQTLRHIQHK